MRGPLGREVKHGEELRVGSITFFVPFIHCGARTGTRGTVQDGRDLRIVVGDGFPVVFRLNLGGRDSVSIARHTRAFDAGRTNQTWYDDLTDNVSTSRHTPASDAGRTNQAWYDD